MTLVVTHPKILPGPDDDDPNTISPTDWNIAHTLTGTADASQLNANVVQSVVNDTNVTGSIAAQALTFGWTGTLALSRFAQGTDGQLVVGQTSAASQYKTLTGAISLSAAGSTALTTSAFANPTGSVGLTAVNGTATTAMRSDGAPALSQAIVPTWTGAHTFNPASGTAITINPVAASTSAGIVLTQTSPTNATPVAGPFAFNLFNITDSCTVTGTGVDSTGLNNGGAVGFRVNTLFSGANVHAAGTLISGLYTSTVTSTAAQGDITGLAGTAYCNVAASISGFLEGLNGVAIVGASGSGVNVLSGADLGAMILTGGSANYRFGVNIASFGNSQGTTNDAGIAFLGAGVVGYKNAILLSNVSGGAPLSTTGNLISSDTAYTLANILNLGNITVTGNIAAFPFLGISGAGKAIFGAPIASLGAALNFAVTAPSSGIVGIGVSTNTTTGFSALSATNSTSATEIDVIANEANRTAVHFGQTVGNWGEVVVTSPNGMLVGTAGAVPLIIGTNNTARMRVTGAGLVNIGTDVAPLATFTVNKNAAAPAAAITATALLQLSSADTVQPVALIDSFGTGNIQPFIVARRARGTAASFTATQNGDALGYFGMVGATGANTFASETSAGGTTGGIFFGAVATENWSATNQGCQLRLYTTTNGTLAIAETLRLQAPGVVLNPGVAVAAGGTAGTGYMMSSTTNLGVFYGSGAPTLSAAQGSIYLRTDGSSTSTRLYVNTNGSTTWTNVTTAA